MSETPRSTREQFKSGFGMVMTMIGAAVGLGNLWRFPYMVGMFGGGAFVFCYLVIIILFGMPLMMVEWSAGRWSRRGPLGFYRASGIKGANFFGWLNLGGLVMSLSVYSVVISWALYYAVQCLTGTLAATNAGDVFNGILGSANNQFIYTIIIVLLVCATLMFGIQKGLERVSKYGMPLLFVLMIVIVIRVVTLPGAMEGIAYYLVPDFTKIDGATIVGAMGQAFFSLCLGGTFMVILGSYMRPTDNLRNTAIKTIIGDTCAGLLAGFMILPAAYAFGIQVDSGPNLMFITTPEIFKLLPGGGMFFCFIFFVLVILAAFLSDCSGFEVIIATLCDEFKLTRKKAIIGFGILQILLAYPACKSLDWLLAVDQLFGSTLQPITCGLIAVAYLFMLPKIDALRALDEGNTSGKPIMPNWLYYWTKFGIPVGIVVIFIVGLQGFLPMVIK